MFEQPSQDRLARSRELESLIREEIRSEGGWIDFAKYMQMAMYSPGLGYYAANWDVFGAAGDFVTAPGLGGLFAACLATQVKGILEDPGMALENETGIFEFGAGNGDLAVGLLPELDRLGALPAHYTILETGAALQARQQDRIGSLPAELAERVRWIDSLPSSLHGVVIANEVLDAMPFERFRIRTDGAVVALGVQASPDGFGWAEGECTDELAAFLQNMALPPGYESEWNRQAPAWVRSIGERLRSGVMLLVDYGYDRAAYYHPERSTGTMHCHYRHHVHDDPFLWPGLQDITAHVDFSAVSDAAREVGLKLLGYLDQARFLIGAGFGEIYAERHASAGLDSPQAVALANEARRLTMPQEMGEQFKVIALGSGCRAPAAFANQDQSYRLVA